MHERADPQPNVSRLAEFSEQGGVRQRGLPQRADGACAVATQSQVNYKRRWTSPRFHPLAACEQGAWLG
eukprot:9293607-Alexandrium_andersonii.AAC.1